MAATIREERAAGAIPLYVHPGWAKRFPWLVQGTTGRGGEEAFDLALFGTQRSGAVLERWRTLRTALRMPAAAHARQVHGKQVLTHRTATEGLLVSDGYDAHVTRQPGLLLAVSIADCVPVVAVDPDTRCVGAMHAGWRGVAGGVLEAGLAAMTVLGAAIERVEVHFGPAICGACYEVGPEVHAALGLPTPTRNTPVDLRAVLAAQALALGVAADRVTSSEFCTRCGDSPFFSHRGGCAERQMSVIGARAEAG